MTGSSSLSQTLEKQTIAMDSLTQYQQHHHIAYDPSQIQAYNQSAQEYYAYYYNQQQYSYYTQHYTNAYQPQHQLSQQDPNSIHPPGLEPTRVAGSEQGFAQTDVQNQQNSYYPHGVQNQQLNSSLAGVQGQQWRGALPIHGGQRPMIGPSPHRGGGKRAGRSFRGGGRGSYGRGRGPQFPPSSTPSLAPPQMAWCELCRVDCNTLEILEQHRNGKRHKKNLQVYEELQKLNKILVEGQNEQMPISASGPIVPDQSEIPEEKHLPQENLSYQASNEENKVEIEQQKVSEESKPSEEQTRKPRTDHFEARGRGIKRKMRGGRGGGKWMRTYEGSRRSIEPPKPKEVVPLICELCNVKCDTAMVFQSHLTGKKHLSNLKRFQRQQSMLGQAALQALYPALQAFCEANANASTSFAPQFQGFFAQPGPSLLPHGQSYAPGLAITSELPPPSVLETQDQPGGENYNAAVGEAKIHEQSVTENSEAESSDTKFEKVKSECERKEFNLAVDNSIVVAIPESKTVPSDQVAALPGPDNKMEELESKSQEPSE